MKSAVLFPLFAVAITGCATTAQDVTPPAPTVPVAAPAAPIKAAKPAPAVAHPQPIPPAVSTPATSEVVQAAADKEKQPAVQSEKYPDIWSRIRKGYGLKPLDSPYIARHEQWFVNNAEYMQAMMDRARMYLFYIVEEVEKRPGVPMEIALLPAIESAYKPYAYSRAKASGLWQFIAPTGRLYGLNMNWWYDERRDVIASTRAALDYLQKLYNDFGDWHLALAAYNAGEGKIGRMIEYNRKRNQPTDFQYLKLKQETVHYVPKLIAMANIIANPDKYGVQLLSIPDQPYFVRVDVGSQIDLGVVSKLTDVPVNELQYINPHLNRWATHPEGPHHVLLPVDKKEAFLEGLSTLPAEQRVQWFGHDVKRGDTLASIANRYHVSVEAVRGANRLPSNALRVGQSLMIPVSSRALNPAYTAVIAKPASPQTTWNTGGTKTPVIHRVRTGETLWSIARRYGVLVSQIVEWNVLETDSVLKLGQRLRIFPSGIPAAKIDDDSPNG
ncbi:MAG TPA: LysM peptidoglycan-binding domain-containing protein [Burkholderiales bacterium]|nr:LysM peptidoglycan-binding domain-containing protein [Burkholderiales bacterium]